MCVGFFHYTFGGFNGLIDQMSAEEKAERKWKGYIASLPAATRVQFIQQWKKDIVASCDVEILAAPAGGGTEVKLHCYIPRKTRLSGFSWTAKNRRLQWKRTVTPGNVVKLTAAAVGFNLQNQWEKTVSHLCHNETCLNPRHVVYESLAANKGRNGCSGPNGGCTHRPRCVRKGPLADGDSTAVALDDNDNFQL